jgi:DNA sulfur modification protein DndB
LPTVDLSGDIQHQPYTRLAPLSEGRAIIAGRLSKSNTSVLLTGNVIKRHLRIPLTPEEKRAEEAFRGLQTR